MIIINIGKRFLIDNVFYAKIGITTNVEINGDIVQYSFKRIKNSFVFMKKDDFGGIEFIDLFDNSVYTKINPYCGFNAGSVFVEVDTMIPCRKILEDYLNIETSDKITKTELKKVKSKIEKSTRLEGKK